MSIKLDEANASDYDALVLPGGVINPDQLRTNETALSFVRDFFQQHKPVAAICHGPQILINAEVVDGRKMTSVNSISKDLKNAGANWEDSEVVVDHGLVTSRTPKDLPAFNAKMVEEIKEGKHEEQTI
jgi:protease I